MTGIWVIWREWSSGKNPGAAYRDPGVAESRPGVRGNGGGALGGLVLDYLSRAVAERALPNAKADFSC